MTGLISFILLVLGAISVWSSGILVEQEKFGPAIFGLIVGSILLLCSWVLA